ncbi:major facilitator superfamily domain-containing protein [Apiosordaria backusii]|uniref:Major facilitator superfamily domain-containing protein n=1 Tax=Apiosordaria backusii TaxID=314023 RepID=A0AA40AXJ4_9PEZI|nr:major facilitator superfamily domain-containing protein [Apiosordaria backusii]
MGSNSGEIPQRRRWLSSLGRKSSNGQDAAERRGPTRWTMGILEDKETIEVPGSVLLLAPDHNEPLGLRNAPARTSHSSIPVGILRQATEKPPPVEDSKKKTKDGKIILEPQPDDSANDPLNWPVWRRDFSLLSLGLYCLVGGGMTPILAAGFTDVANDYGIDVHTVSLTTGLYMMGMGLGSVVFSPTAILWGKRPVYLFSSLLFILTSVWCALSPNFASLVVARILQGVSVSPVECLPSATIAEIFFLHERAFRIGIYTLLLLGGKNLVPLVSAAIIQRLGWRWVFWIVAIIVGFCSVLLFVFVPESFWDRAPHRRKKSRPNFFRRFSSKHDVAHATPPVTVTPGPQSPMAPTEPSAEPPKAVTRTHQVGFAAEPEYMNFESPERASDDIQQPPIAQALPVASDPEKSDRDTTASSPASRTPNDTDSESLSSSRSGREAYTNALRGAPPKSFVQQLKPFNGRLNKDKWYKAAIRPLILFSYPAVLWSSIVYACSVGWLIVISESMAVIYREEIYDFDALQTGLVYISPFVGGVLGTAVAGRVSDVIVKAMARRNGGLYEPEFRLIMAIPVAITTVIGLMGFGWSAEVRDHWMVPTAFFGIISFGCCLGSTTSITFCVDSYRQYAGEALVTLNFCKNVLHGLVFSLFVTGWLSADGPKKVYIWIGVIQLILLLFTIPMYIYGKRARMWTVRKNFMERF